MIEWPTIPTTKASKGRACKTAPKIVTMAVGEWTPPTRREMIEITVSDDINDNGDDNGVQTKDRAMSKRNEEAKSLEPAEISPVPLSFSPSKDDKSSPNMYSFFEPPESKCKPAREEPKASVLVQSEQPQPPCKQPVVVPRVSMDCRPAARRRDDRNKKREAFQHHKFKPRRTIPLQSPYRRQRALQGVSEAWQKFLMMMQKSEASRQQIYRLNKREGQALLNLNKTRHTLMSAARYELKYSSSGGESCYSSSPPRAYTYQAAGYPRHYYYNHHQGYWHR